MAGLTALNAAPGSAPSPAQAPAAVRLFIALWPPPAVQRALLSCQQAVCSPGLAWPVPAAQLHLTLHFLGAVPRQRLPALQAALRWRVQRYTLVESLAGPPSAYRVLQTCAARRG